MNVPCPVCESGRSSFHRKVDGFDYFRCGTCGSIHVDSAALAAIDAGKSPCMYDEDYWRREASAALERARGAALVRAGEAILYARRPIRRFLDVGAGAGCLLDALSRLLPSHSGVFYGIESFPPDAHTQNANYRVGDVHGIGGIFDAGTCIEVAEHLTPRMMRALGHDLAAISAPGTLWLFNTGSPDYVLHEDPAYLDPVRRGHIVAYGLTAIRHLLEPSGFRISAIPGKSYAWFAEFAPTGAPDFSDRVYRPLATNRALLDESGLLFQAAFESARASLYQRDAARLGAGALAPEACSEYQSVLASRSWRYTQPLRSAARWLRNVRAVVRPRS